MAPGSRHGGTMRFKRFTAKFVASRFAGGKRSPTCVVMMWRTLVPASAWAAGSAWYLLPLGLLPRALALLAAFDAAPGGHAYTPLLFRTVILQAGFGMLLTAGVLFSRVL